jgi:hypothetical protein
VSDDTLPDRSPRRRLPRGCLALAVLVLVALVAACGFAGAGIRRGAVRPPELQRELGPVTLYSVVTLDPECPLAFCGTERINSSMQRYYMAWVVVVVPGTQGPEIRSYRLLLTPIDW